MSLVIDLLCLGGSIQGVDNSMCTSCRAPAGGLFQSDSVDAGLAAQAHVPEASPQGSEVALLGIPRTVLGPL